MCFGICCSVFIVLLPRHYAKQLGFRILCSCSGLGLRKLPRLDCTNLSRHVFVAVGRRFVDKANEMNKTAIGWREIALQVKNWDETGALLSPDFSNQVRGSLLSFGMEIYAKLKRQLQQAANFWRFEFVWAKFIWSPSVFLGIEVSFCLREINFGHWRTISVRLNELSVVLSSARASRLSMFLPVHCWTLLLPLNSH